MKKFTCLELNVVNLSSWKNIIIQHKNNSKYGTLNHMHGHRHKIFSDKTTNQFGET